MPRTDTASRVVGAPTERVFAALVDREALLTWLPPSGMTGRFDRFDPRTGGSYRLVLTYHEPAAAKGKALALPVALFGAAFIFALAAVTALAVGVVDALATLIGPLAAGFAGLLIFAASAAALGWYGYERLRRAL